MHSGKARRRPTSGKSAGRAAVIDDEGGFFAGLADRTFENPAMSGGVVVMVLTAAAIVSNAMFLQNIRHPDPLFATRSASIEQAAPVPLPRARAEHLPKAEPAPVVEAVAREPDPVPVPVPQPEVQPPADVRLMKDIQKALADAGLYGGSVDGKMGLMTRTAIEKFQRRAGLTPNGSPSEALLASLRAPPKPAPAPAPRPVVEAAKPVPPKPVAAAPSPDVITEQARYREVQMALNDIGYGPVGVDGHPGAETADAIRRFELDNGLPLTGNPTDRVVARLVKIGALPQR